MDSKYGPLPILNWVQAKSEENPPIVSPPAFTTTMDPGDAIIWALPNEEPLTRIESALFALDARHLDSVAGRLRELQSSDVDCPLLAEESVMSFVNMLTEANWPPPTHIGLKDNGDISASWRNEWQEALSDNAACSGSVAMVFPSSNPFYEVTAMFGMPSNDTEWIQVVGNLEENKAVGLLDQILVGFHR